MKVIETKIPGVLIVRNRMFLEITVDTLQKLIQNLNMKN